MIPLRQSVRLLAGAAKSKVPGRILAARFQSVEATPKLELKQDVKPTESQNFKNSQKGVKPSNDSKQARKSKRYPPRNQKLFDISRQVHNSIEDPNVSIDESVDMLEEGLSYLREVQVAENIADSDLQFAFQKVASQILYKSIEGGGSKTPEDILDILIQQRVAHKYHFALVASSLLKTQDASLYHSILKVWVKFVEYEKTNGVNRMPVFAISEFNVKPHALNNLAYFAFVHSCINEDIKVDYADALKLLQTDQLPFYQYVGQTLKELSLGEKYATQIGKFNQIASKLEASNLDPNGNVIYRRIETATERKDPNALNNTFNEVVETSEKTKLAISEDTMVRFMRGYLEASKPEEVFKIFQNMLKNGITKPSIATWECVLKAMGHPAYISKNDKLKISENIDRTVETIVSSGTALTAKTISVIVSCFANLDQFDKVEEYLNKYTVQGKGTLPVISHTKNNILIGMLLNNKVVEAEAKLNEYMESNEFVPITSTMNAFLNFYVKKQDYASVEGILKFMKDHNIPEDVATFTTVIDVYFKIHREKGLTPNVQVILSTITSSAAIKLNDVTYAALIDGLGRNGSNLEAARQIFTHATAKYKNSPQMHTAMLKSELEFGSIPMAEAIFNKYIAVVSNDARIWNMMISSLLRKNEGLALAYYENMKAQSSTRVEPNAYTYYFLLNHFVRRGNNEKVQYMIDELAHKSVDQLGASVPKLLKSLVGGEYKFDPSLLAQIS